MNIASDFNNLPYVEQVGSHLWRQDDNCKHIMSILESKDNLIEQL